MQYLVGQMLTCLLGAAILGLAIGWIWWGLRLRRASERAADLEQRVSKLSGYPARLTDLEATHAAFVASRNEEDAKYNARIAELAPLAAKAPELEKGLAAKTAEWEGLRTQIAGKTIELEALQAQCSDLANLHQAAASTAEQMPKLTSRLQSSLVRVGELEGALRTKNARLAEHVQAHADKDVRLGSLTKRIAELEPVAQKVAALEAQIAQHEEAHREMDEHLAQVMGQMDELKPLAGQVERPATRAHAEKEEHVAELIAAAALVSELTAYLEEKDRHVGALLSRVQELQPLEASHADFESRVESAEYETSLATRKLRMAETSLAAHESEIAKLHDRLLMQKADSGSAIPLKSMAAAAGASSAAIGFYDVNEAGAKDITPVVPPDHVREFEKRIEELRTIESSKDAEISNLRGKLADVEAAPDPDGKRQILLAAKNAELTHLRGALNSLLQPISRDEIALRAFSYAKDRGFCGGSPTEDWLRAERDSHFNRLAYAWESMRGGTMF